MGREIPRCGPTGAPSWGELSGRAHALAGTTITVRGTLALGTSRIQTRRCREVDPRTGNEVDTCCPGSVHTNLVLEGAGDAGLGSRLALEGMWCSGDQSRLCCNAGPIGGSLVVTGRLEASSPPEHRQSWRLQEPLRVCVT